MPELPEVETVRRGLAPHLEGKKICSVVVRRGDLRLPVPEDFAKRLHGRTLIRLDRRAKYLLFRMDNDELLIIHLGMSGSLVLRRDVAPALRTHDHVVVEWSDGWIMIFHDPRRFGSMQLAPEKGWQSLPAFRHLGPEPLGRAMGKVAFQAVLSASRAPVKTVLMDQRKLVGVGNIYACEALFRAGINPVRSANEITRREADRLLAAIREVLETAIASGGSTLRDYVRSSGDAGYFQHQFNVYGRTHHPCRVCNTPIQQMKQAGRSSFFCPACQPR